jgi:membrane-associated phospholipid phosphatase
METQHEATAEALPHGTTHDHARGYALAQHISHIFHPIFLATGSCLIVGYGALPQQRWLGLGWAVLSILMMVVPGVLFFRFRLRQGAYSDTDVSVRHQRNELYFFCGAVLLVNLVVLLLLNAPLDFVALLLSVLLLALCGWAINLFWKISVHASSISSCATISMIYMAPLGVVLWPCALLVGWARVRTGNHTPAQVGAGLVLAAACIGSVFWALGIM